MREARPSCIVIDRLRPSSNLDAGPTAGAALLWGPLIPACGIGSRSMKQTGEPRSPDDNGGRSSNRGSAPGDMFRVEQSPRERDNDSTPVRIPSCARATGPTKSTYRCLRRVSVIGTLAFD